MHGGVEGIVDAMGLLYHGAAVQRTPSRSSAGPIVALALCAALGGCEDAYEAGRAPVIESVRPEPAPPGAPVTLLGRGFGLRGERDRVWLDGVELAVESWTETAVLVRLPERAPGSSTLVVRSGALVSAPYPFELIARFALDGGPADDVGDIIP